MDIQLQKNAPELIQAVREELEYYTPSDIQRDPWNTFVYNQCGFSQSSVDSWLRKMESEILAVIDFASTWEIDASEWDFSDLEKQAEFAISYISICIERDLEWDIENSSEEESRAAA